MYDYLELLECHSWDVDRARREIEDMRRARNVETVESKPAGPDRWGLHSAGDLRRDREEME